jgi:uncharacterized delta-60 repeat protein
MRKQVGLGLVLLASALAPGASASTGVAPGTLDTTFGGTSPDPAGITTSTFPPGGLVANAATTDSSGRILVAGDINFGNDGGYFVERFTPDGHLDKSFGALGTGRFAETDIGLTYDVRAMTVLPDGEIVLVGEVRSSSSPPDSGNEFELIDVSAGGLGASEHTYDFASSSSEEALGVAQQPSDGKLVLVGGARVAGNTEWALARVSGTTFALDNSFDGDGKVLTDWQADGGVVFQEAAVGVGVLSDGTIVASGMVGDPGGRQAIPALAAYKGSNGAIDPSWGFEGTRTLVFPGMDGTTPGGLAVTSDNHVLVAMSGDHTVGAQSLPEIGLAGFTADGRFDPSFGTDGLTITHPPATAGALRGAGLSISPDGKLLVGGSATNNGVTELLAVRYLADGTPDPGFGLGGVAEVAVPNKRFGNSVGAFATAGRVVTAGSAEQTGLSDSVAALAGFTGGSAADVSTTLSGPAAAVAVGQHAQLTLSVSNGGPDLAGDVTAHVHLPAELTFKSAAPGSGDSCTGTTDLTCTLHGFVAGQSRSVTIDTVAASAGSAVVQAGAAGPVFDPVAGNDSAQQTVTVVAGADALAPTLTARLLPSSLRKILATDRLRVKCTVSEAAGIDVAVTTKARVGGHMRTVRLASGHLSAPRSRSLTASLDLTAVGASALRGLRSAKLTLSARATDLAGNRSRPVKTKTRVRR